MAGRRQREELAELALSWLVVVSQRVGDLVPWLGLGSLRIMLKILIWIRAEGASQSGFVSCILHSQRFCDSLSWILQSVGLVLSELSSEKAEKEIAHV